MKEMKKRIILLFATGLCLLSSLSAQEIRKFEIGADATYGISLKKLEANRYGFDLFGGYKVNDRFSAGAGVNYTSYMSRLLPSGIENVMPGDEAVLMGKSGNECITAEDLAGWAGTISYEILCSSAGRVEHIYAESNTERS